MNHPNSIPNISTIKKHFKCHLTTHTHYKFHEDSSKRKGIVLFSKINEFLVYMNGDHFPICEGQVDLLSILSANIVLY